MNESGNKSDNCAEAVPPEGLERLIHNYDQHNAMIVALTEENARLMKALGPFASGVAAFHARIPDEFELLVKIDAVPMFTLKVGDVRRAASALNLTKMAPAPIPAKAADPHTAAQDWARRNGIGEKR